MGGMKRRRAAVMKREVAADKRPKRSETIKTASVKPSLAERVRRLENRLQQFGGAS